MEARNPTEEIILMVEVVNDNGLNGRLAGRIQRSRWIRQIYSSWNLRVQVANAGHTEGGQEDVQVLKGW